MKKYNYILLGMLSLFFVTTLTSCSDYFDQVPDDRLSLEEIFKRWSIEISFECLYLLAG